MIVDDAPANLAVLSDALEEASYRVLVATDGRSTLEQLRYVRPDVILLDAVMPGMDGFETCRRIKADPAHQSIPVLFMTCLSELDDLLRGFGEGAVDYIVKPIRPPEVLARIATHIAQSRRALLAETALERNGFATIALDENAGIVCLSDAARPWLAELAGCTPDTADRLSPPLREWVLRSMRAEPGHEPETFGAERRGKKLLAKFTRGQAEGEYLLLVWEQVDGWDLRSLHADLGLTVREAEILMWISRGKTNRDIGQILGSSPRTVNKHLEHVFEKLGVATRAAAVAVALDRVRGGIEPAI